MGNTSKFELGDAVVELDRERVLDTINQRGNVSLVLRFHKKDARLTDGVIKKAADRIIALRAVMTGTRIELYYPRCKSFDDAIEIAEEFALKVNAILSERDRTVSGARAHKSAVRSSGYRNIAPTAR